MKAYEKQKGSDGAISKGNGEIESIPKKLLQAPEEHRLRKVLDARHLLMITIGGALSTGLLIRTVSALRAAGPGAILISSQLLALSFLWCCVGWERLQLSYLWQKGFTGYCRRYVDEALWFARGWTYVFLCLFVAANQLVAGSLTILYWIDAERVNPAVWVTMFLVLITSINILGVRFFGEIEFRFSIVKVCICLGLICMLLVIALGGGPIKDRLGFRFWNNPESFWKYQEPSRKLLIEGDLGHSVSFVSVLVTSVFA